MQVDKDTVNKIKGILEKEAPNIIKDYLRNSAFTDRKPTDTPTEDLQPVNRRYVNFNGPTSGRPTASVIGQFYLDTSLASGNGKPIWWNGIGWVDATGTYV